MEDSSRQAFEDFRTFCDDILEKTGWTRKVLSDKLGLNPSYFARLYHKRTPSMPHSVLARARSIAESMLSDKLSARPEKVKIEEGLPVDVGATREKITRLEALLDREHNDNKVLQDRVAVLEDQLRQAKADSEKKIYELESRFAAALRIEIERLTGRLAGGRGAANG